MACKERRLMLVGDRGCGKTCLLRAAGCEVTTGHPTVYYKFLVGQPQRRKRKPPKKVLIGIWDVPAEEPGGAAREAVYPRLDAAIVVFAIDDPPSLHNARNKWYRQVRERCSRRIPVVLVGTKLDLRTESGVSYLEGLAVAEDMKAYAYVECSALDETEAINVFKFAVRSVIKKSHCAIM